MSVPQSDQMADQFDAIRPAQNTPGEKRRAATLVKRRATDASDRELLLDALGLNGRPIRTNTGPGGERLSPTLCGEACDTAPGYWRHVQRGEKACGAAREAYRAYRAGREGS